MKKSIINVAVGAAIIVMLLACKRAESQQTPVERVTTEEENVETEDDFAGEETGDSLEDGKSLNDIRFADFKEKDWYDNEYFRALRKYLDAFNSGEIEDEELEPYRKEVQGKFAVYCAQSYIGGGMLIELVFIDHPKDMFWAWVYSDVDIRTESVMGYRVFSIRKHGENATSKAEILQILREHPENKLW